MNPGHETSNRTLERVPLKAHEAYLYDMFTLASFRGMNLAPRLRLHVYRVLGEMGYTHFYSVSETFNTPAVRFKVKLKAKILQRILAVDLFGKFRWRKILKTYD